MRETPTSVRSAVAQPLKALLRSPFAAALTTPHGVDRYLELLNPAWSVLEPKAKVVDVIRETADCVTLLLRPNGAWSGHRAGQFVQLGVEIDGVRHTRCYSISSSAKQRDGHITVTVKAKEDGFVSRHIVRELMPGAILPLSRAEGDFVLPEERPSRILFISGGSGITPVMGMLRTLLDEGYDGRITFLHYAPSAGALIYRSELEALRMHPQVDLALAFTRASGGELEGHFEPAHLEGLAPDFAEHETYACGPAALLQDLRRAYRDAGCEAKLHEERFTLELPDFATDGGDEPGTLHFVRSGQKAEGNGKPLLEQAEAIGLEPDFGCRMGVCHTCTCRKVKGKVRDVRTGVISSAEDELIRLCVSAPVGDVALDL
jgi:ferredoxin-NADP reductase